MMLHAVIDDVVTSYSPRIDSHKTGWARMQRCLVQDAEGECLLLGPKEADLVHEARHWLVSHAMEFTGKGYNLTGGWSEKDADRVRRLATYQGKLYSLERPMPDLEKLLRPVAARRSALDLTMDEWAAVTAKVWQARMITHIELLDWADCKEPDVVLGDSHSVAHYMRGRLVLRNDGLTLHGMLKRGLYEMLRQADVTWRVPKLTICAGNIDIRHHLMRQPDAYQAADDMIVELARQINHLRGIGAIDDFEVVAPLPVEHEGRKIPGTGCYKGTSFYGSQAQRALLVQLIKNRLIDLFGYERVYNWPEEWYQLDPEEYATRFMEKPRSVHLSPAHHRWDYINNQLNPVYGGTPS